MMKKDDKTLLWSSVVVAGILFFLLYVNPKKD